MILEFARRRNDGVGSNLDGAVAPPFWAYLLSSLELIFPCVLGEVSPEITQGIALWEEPTRLAPGEQIPERTRLLLMGPGAFANGVKSWIGAKSRDQAIWADPSTAEQIAKELGVPHNWWLLPEGMARNSSANGNHNARGTPIRIPARRQSRGKRNRAIRIAARVLRRLQIVPAERNWQAPAAELVPGGEPRASVDTEGTLFLPDAPCDPPNWLLEIARLSDVDLAGRDWSILPARGFRSQKVSFFFGEKKGSAEPDSIAIKMTQHAQFNERLLNEHRALSVLTAREPFAMEGIPRPVFAGSHRGLAVIGQTKLPGEPFASHTSGKVDCPVAARALEAIHDLAMRSARQARGAEHAEAIKVLLQRLELIYRPSAELLQAAQQAVDALARIEHVPTVFLHGDPEPQNMIVGPGGRIALLDWENAELDGPPLWDHFSFMIAYTRLSLERSGVRPTPRSVANRLLSPSPWSQWMTRSTSALAKRLDLPAEAVAPLLTLHAAVMAVREAWRLNPERIHRGTWIRWMGEVARRRDSLREFRGKPSLRD